MVDHTVEKLLHAMIFKSKLSVEPKSNDDIGFFCEVIENNALIERIYPGFFSF